jgi:secreted Zn-dependent insulinase-like peptidase
MHRPPAVSRITPLQRFAQWGLYLAALFALAACQMPKEPPVAQAPQATEVIVSPADQRAYRYLELPNRLRVLLVSDPAADKAAAALDVNVGSRQDPADRAGLAHFLEHMLFLGTERYPQAGEYQNYITAHGGNHNAYTSFEHTNYFFDIDARNLEPALDRFSQFFVAPLFSAQYVDREKNAVHSEYRANYRDDGRRGFDVLKAAMNPAHPYSTFSVGSLETLSDREGSATRDELLKFYRANYSANLMTLVVIGRESLDQLQTMVVPRFSAVPNHQQRFAPLTQPLFSPGRLPALLEMQSLKGQRSLSVMWPIPDQRDDYRHKSLDYIGNVIGHEGAGSLLSYLKARGWALALSAGEGFEYQGGSTFNVTVELTEAGAAHRDEVVAALYQALARLRADGVLPWLFDEQRVVAEQRFRFRDRVSPIDDASRLANSLQKYPPAEVLRGPGLMESFNPERVRALLDALTPQNMLLVFSAPEVQGERKSPWYETPYALQPLPAAQVRQWAAATPAEAIRLPQPNIFIAQRLELKSAAGAATKPQLLQDLPGLQLWYAPDSVFALPKATVALSLRSPIASDTAEHLVLTELLVRLVGENLNEYSYPAMLAGLHYGIARNSRGINVTVRGYGDKQALLLERILQALREPRFDAATFGRLRADYQRELEDEDKLAPYRQLIDELGDVLLRQHWTETTLAPIAAKVDLGQLEAHARQLFAVGDVQMLVYGNHGEQDARALGDLVQRGLLAGMKPVPAPAVQVLQLSKRDWRRELAVAHDDAALVWYRQAADNQRRTRAALGVSAQMLAADFYTSLRTRQQLGYIVMSTPYPMRDVPGLVFLVQSPVAGPQALADAYAAFLERWTQRDDARLRKLFDRHRAALASRLAEAPKNQGEQFDRYWQDLLDGETGFDSRALLLAEVQKLTFEDWLPLFRRDVLAPQGHALWLAISGKFTGDALRVGQPVIDLERFKARQPFYRFR